MKPAYKDDYGGIIVQDRLSESEGTTIRCAEAIGFGEGTGEMDRDSQIFVKSLSGCRRDLFLSSSMAGRSFTSISRTVSYRVFASEPVKVGYVY